MLGPPHHSLVAGAPSAAGKPTADETTRIGMNHRRQNLPAKISAIDISRCFKSVLLCFESVLLCFERLLGPLRHTSPAIFANQPHGKARRKRKPAAS